MSKRNRYKFKQKQHRSFSDGQANGQNQAVGPSPVATEATNGSLSRLASAPAGFGGSRSDGAFAQHAAEYRVIRNDMIRLIVLNGIMLAAVLALYYVNKSSGLVERLFHNWI